MNLREKIIAALIARAQRTPYMHIYSPDGLLYMERWWLLRPSRWLPISVRVHHIVRPDTDRHFHDHPWPFVTLIMRGSYLEQLPTSQRQAAAVDSIHSYTRLRSVGSVVCHRATDRHRITRVDRADGAWTLFIMLGGRANRWGFYTEQGKVYWRDYLDVPEGNEEAVS